MGSLALDLDGVVKNKQFGEDGEGTDIEGSSVQEAADMCQQSSANAVTSNSDLKVRLTERQRHLEEKWSGANRIGAAGGEGRRLHEMTTRGKQYTTGDVTKYKER